MVMKVPAAIHGDFRTANYYHEFLEFPLRKIMCVSIPVETVDQALAFVCNCLLSEHLICFQTNGCNDNETVSTGFCFNASDEIILPEVR